MVKKTGDWKKHVETNSRLMKKFEESRAELEKVLRTAQEGLEEKGDPEELLRRHTVSSSLMGLLTWGQRRVVSGEKRTEHPSNPERDRKGDRDGRREERKDEGWVRKAEIFQVWDPRKCQHELQEPLISCLMIGCSYPWSSRESCDG